MLLTSWLTVLRPEPDCDRPIRKTSPTGRLNARRPVDPWQAAEPARRGDPFRPPVRRACLRGTRLRRSELRWLIHQRQF